VSLCQKTRDIAILTSLLYASTGIEEEYVVYGVASLRGFVDLRSCWVSLIQLRFVIL
jgi:hypothetical protein